MNFFKNKIYRNIFPFLEGVWETVCYIAAKLQAMKKILTLLPALFFIAGSCDRLMTPRVKDGYICISISQAEDSKSSPEDVDGYMLIINDSDGDAVYSGTFGDFPDSFAVKPGVYTVSARSRDFVEPMYDTPQWGATQSVVVEEGEQTAVTLFCAMVNGAVRLSIDPSFAKDYPSGTFYLKSPDGILMYGYSERRYAYFRPGPVALDFSDGKTSERLTTFQLSARDLIELKLSIGATKSRSGIRLSVDTSMVRTTRPVQLPPDFGEGGSSSGQGGASSGDGGFQGDDADGWENTVYSVKQARGMAGAVGVKVKGWIVGGDLTSAKCSFKAPFSSRTNFVLGPSADCTDRSECLSVQLQKGDFRDELNLVDHPELLGTSIVLSGDIVGSYYGIPGLQSLSGYER